MTSRKDKFPHKKITLIVIGFLIFLILDVVIFIKPFQEYFKSEGGISVYLQKTVFQEDCRRYITKDSNKCSCIADDLVNKYAHSTNLYDKQTNDFGDILFKWNIRSKGVGEPVKEIQDSIVVCEKNSNK